MRSPALRGLGLLLLLPTAKGDAGPADGGAPKVAAAPPPRLVTPILGHPRLWLRPEDPPRLRAWAKASNPLWSEGLRAVGERAREEMDRHGLLDRAGCERAPAPCEAYAELFAFLSLVEPSAQERQDYGRRGHAVLMGLLRRAARPVPGDPLGAPDFSVGNASRWSGEAFPLAVDWLYPRLAAADKAMARQVFLRWSEEQLRASVMGADHPAPVGLLHDPALLADRPRRRAAANNYFCAHLRNLTLMALALDPADDPDEPAVGRTYRRLGDYLANAVGAWLYMNDHLLRHEARGGLSPEGDQYGPQSLAYVAQTHLALRTAGVADPKVWGPAVELDGHPFWDRLVPAFLHHLSPSPRRRPEGEGLAFQPHWMGDGQVYDLGDWIDLFAPFGVLGRLRGRDGIFDAARWI